MNSSGKIIFTLGLILLICGSLWGCKGGIVPALDDIAGPALVGRQSTVEYSISLANGTGATYLWSCNPPDAGQFADPTSAKTNFTPGWVDVDTQIEILVVVTTDQLGAVVKKKKITILTRTGWGLTWGGDDTDIAYGLEVDASGNIYIGGFFNGTVDFDPGPGTDEHTAIGYEEDICLSKFSSDGKHLWTLTWGGKYSDSINRLKVDSFGNVYVTGIFEGTVDLDPGPGVDEHTTDFRGSPFLCKFNSNGDYQWALSLWEGSYAYISSLGLDDTGNIYITGNFRGTADFDPGPGVEEYSVDGDFGYDFFIATYSPNTDFRWVKIWDGDSSVSGSGIVVDRTGNIYVTGDFRTTTDFDPGPGVDQYSPGYGYDAFLCKFDSNDEYEWVRVWDLGYYDWGSGIELDDSDNVYVAGTVRLWDDSCTPFGFHAYPEMSDFGGYIRKFDPSGLSLWYNTFTEDDLARCNGIDIDDSGNVLIAGTFESMVDFDPGPGIEKYTSLGGNDIYVSSYNQSGVFQWAHALGGKGTAFNSGVATSPSGDIYVLGYFNWTMDLDPGPETDVHTAHGNSSYDVFLVKLLPDGYW